VESAERASSPFVDAATAHSLQLALPEHPGCSRSSEARLWGGGEGSSPDRSPFRTVLPALSARANLPVGARSQPCSPLAARRGAGGRRSGVLLGVRRRPRARGLVDRSLGRAVATCISARPAPSNWGTPSGRAARTASLRRRGALHAQELHGGSGRGGGEEAAREILPPARVSGASAGRRVGFRPWS